VGENGIGYLLSEVHPAVYNLDWTMCGMPLQGVVDSSHFNSKSIRNRAWMRTGNEHHIIVITPRQFDGSSRLCVGRSRVPSN